MSSMRGSWLVLGMIGSLRRLKSKQNRIVPCLGASKTGLSNSLFLGSMTSASSWVLMLSSKTFRSLVPDR